MSLVGIWALPADEEEALQNEVSKMSQTALSEMAHVCFQGGLGLSRFWQIELASKKKAGGYSQLALVS